MKHTRKILALVLIVMTVLMSLSAFTVSAASTKVVNVSDLTITATTDDELVAGTGIYASAGLAIDGNSKTIDGFEFTKRLKLGGTMKVEGGVVKAAIKVVADGPSKITLYAISSSSSSDRVLQIATFDGSALSAFAEAAAPGAGIAKCEFEVDAAGTYYIGSKSSGINVYYIAVEEVAVCTHIFEDGVCSLCGEIDPSACKHTNKSPATCTDPEKCLDCQKEFAGALGHTAGAEATCTTAQTCTVCSAVIKEALGHTLTFVNTLPTLGESGKTIADCSVCQEHFDYGEVNVMTPGTYVLEADSFAGIAQYSLYDGYVMVVNDVFTCHLSYKYRTDFYESGKEKTFAEDDYVSAYRMNFGGASAFCNNGAGEEAVRNGGLKNYIQIVTTSTTYITVHWGVGGDNREVGIYDMEGNLLRTTEEKATKNDLVVSENIELPAGAYLIGSAASDGGNWIHKITVEVEAPHECSFSEPTCTEPGKCECGATQGEALGHDMVIDAAKAPTCTEAGLTSGEHCSRCDHAVAQEEIPALGHNFAEGKCDCGAEDPNYVAPQPEAEEEVELNFFQKIIAWFTNLINKIIAIFKK